MLNVSDSKAGSAAGIGRPVEEFPKEKTYF